MSDFRQRVQAFVQQKLPMQTHGGAQDLASQHAARVSQILAEFGYDEELQIAGLLHEILQRRVALPEDLRSLGCSEGVILLVQLNTMPVTDGVPAERERRLLMRLENASNASAYMLKTADLLDELRFSDHLLPDDRKQLTKVFAPWFASFLRSFEGSSHETLVNTFKDVMRDRLHARISFYS